MKYALISLIMFSILSYCVLFSMEGQRENRTAYYMALLTSRLAAESIERFSGPFAFYKSQFLTLLEAKKLYDEDGPALDQYTLQTTGIASDPLATEAYLLLIKPEDKQSIMHKLMYACASDGNKETAALLFNCGIDLGTAEDQLSFLEVACAANQQNIVKLLCGNDSIDLQKRCIVQ